MPGLTNDSLSIRTYFLGGVGVVLTDRLQFSFSNAHSDSLPACTTPHI